MFYMDFSYDTFLFPDLPAEPIWYDPLREEGITHEEFLEQQKFLNSFIVIPVLISSLSMLLMMFFI